MEHTLAPCEVVLLQSHCICRGWYCCGMCCYCCCYCRVSAASYRAQLAATAFTTNRKHNDLLVACVNTNNILSLVLKLFTIYGHGRAPRPARNVLQDVKRIDCDQHASYSAGKGKCNRLCQNPELVKSSTWAAQQQTLENIYPYILLGLSKSACERHEARKIETGVREC
jgi:hypothetical protein